MDAPGLPMQLGLVQILAGWVSQIFGVLSRPSTRLLDSYKSACKVIDLSCSQRLSRFQITELVERDKSTGILAISRQGTSTSEK